MLVRIPVPIAMHTRKGRAWARFALAPTMAGDPWWLVYRDDAGEWFTQMCNDKPI